MGYVLQITDSTGGGAGRATTRLHEGLLALGVDSRLLCRENSAGTPGAHALQNTVKATPGGEAAAGAWAKIDRHMAIRNRTSISNTIFSIGYPGYDISALPLVQNAAILHLHWTPRLLSIRGIEQLLRLGKPTFWTQHDRWPTTQGYHFQASEADFAEPGVATTHLLREYELPKLLLEDKRRAFDHPNLEIVCLTDQLADLYRTRSIFTERRIHSIANGIETEIFKPATEAERARTRNLLGIEEDAIVFLLLSQQGQEKRKGYAHVAEALRGTDGLPALAKAREAGRLTVATIGAGGSAEAFPGIKNLPIDTIREDAMLVAVMNACDALVMPSEQESFSLAVLEAMACGLPVISFGHGGMPETEIRTGENGVLIDGRPHPESLAKALDLFCSEGFDRIGCRAGARKTAEKFDAAAVARDMRAIYQTRPEATLASPPQPETESPAPEIKHAARFDYAPSDWLGRQPVEAALAELFADDAPARPIARPKAAAMRHGEPVDLLPLLKLSDLAGHTPSGAITIPSSGRSGHAVFGPYLTPEPGRYEIAATLETQRGPLSAAFGRAKPLVIEASLNANRILAHKRWKAPLFRARSDSFTLSFKLNAEECEAATSGLELRLWTDGRAPITLSKAVLTRWALDA